MADFEWRVYADWNKDGDFVDNIENISNDIKTLTFQLGMTKIYQDVADESTCTIVVNNTDGKYLPENTLSTLYPYIVPNVRIKVMYSWFGVETLMWTGWIESVQVAWRKDVLADVVLKCTGAKQQLEDLDVLLPVYTNTTADVIIEAVLGAAVLPPATGNGWSIGVVGRSEIGTTTYVGDVADFATLDVGDITFETYGDNPPDKGWKIIKEVVQAERGKFFFDRNGKAIFWNRTHLTDDVTIDYIVDSQKPGAYPPANVDYRHGDAIANVIRIKVKPRKSVSSATLWSLNEDMTIPVSSSKTFEATHFTPDGHKTGSSSTSTSGATFSSGTATASVETFGHKSKVTMTNSSPSTPAVMTAINVDGATVTDRNVMVVEATDTTSIISYGKRHELNLTVPLVSFDDAEDIAALELARRKDPRGIVYSIDYKTVKPDGLNNKHQLMFTVGTHLTITLTELGHSDDYFVVGEQHTIGQLIHTTRFYLEPA